MSDQGVWSEAEDYTGEPTPRHVIRTNCGKINFHTASSRFLPPGLEVLREVAIYLAQDAHADYRVLIAAHTDTQDSHENNQVLSDARAKSTLAVLQNDAKAWLEVCEASGGDRAKDVRDMVAWALDALPLRPYAKGKARSVTGFKAAYAEAYPKSPLAGAAGVADDDFWKMVLSLYRSHIFRYVPAWRLEGTKGWAAALQQGEKWHKSRHDQWVRGGRKGAEPLPPIKAVRERQACAQVISRTLREVKWADPSQPAIGCSERDLLVPTEDNRAEEGNRRVEFLYFPTEQDVPKTGEEGLPPDPRVLKEGTLPPWHLEAVYASGRYEFQDLGCPEPYFGDHPLPPGNVVFVIDRSGSMKAGGRWEDLQNRLLLVLSLLDRRYHFGIVSFANEVTCLWGTPGAAQLKTASEANLRQAVDWVYSLEPGGGTATYIALEGAFRSVGLRAITRADGEQNSLEFLSDGAPNPRKQKCEHCREVYDLVRSETCPACGQAQAHRNAPPEWDTAREIEELLTEAKANNTQGWRLNATAFIPERLGANDLLSKGFMEDLTKLSDPPGAYSEDSF